MLCATASNMPLWSLIPDRRAAWIGLVRSIGFFYLRVKQALGDLVAPIVLESSLHGSSVVTCVYSCANSGAASGTITGMRPPLVGLRGGWRSGGKKSITFFYGKTNPPKKFSRDTAWPV